ncbi:MAG: MalY/PatB family protein [Pseudomonadota bacterium]
MTDLFDQFIDNRGTSSLKWEFRVADGAISPFEQADPALGDEQVLPMWVADMDFHAADPIRRAVEARASHGVFGYAVPSQRYFDAIAGWMRRRHSWSIDTDWIVPTPGVVPGIHLIVKRLTQPGDKVLIQRPVYHPFTYAAVNNDRISESNSLRFDGARYDMDFDDLEEKARDPLVKIVLLCSPHNPVGRIWTRAELERFAEICVCNNVIVVADEIHADLIMPGGDFFAYGRLSPELRARSIICTAPSKSFNVAGLQTANMIIEDSDLREAVRKEIYSTGLFTMSPFGIAATQAAYEEGDEWLGAAIAQIHGNIEFVRTFLADNIPQIKPLDLQATYLMWLDCRDLGLEHSELKSLFFETAKLYLDEGMIFGEEGRGFMRLNVACSRETVSRAMQRLQYAVGTL